ncbi:hypothetical protein [Paenibacillus sp. S150]|uniref:hypothetical protein n=1 Tax=Paenibacillus sp. S150 TaxID=2749826 RepID=UPI001C5937EE|nr:hypothetical protein [Paenibacillus sp. S150]MBW4081863.1 hypothetical protein [Paenibacillus sp. S150]
MTFSTRLPAWLQQPALHLKCQQLRCPVRDGAAVSTWKIRIYPEFRKQVSTNHLKTSIRRDFLLKTACTQWVKEKEGLSLVRSGLVPFTFKIQVYMFQAINYPFIFGETDTVLIRTAKPFPLVAGAGIFENGLRLRYP